MEDLALACSIFAPGRAASSGHRSPARLRRQLHADGLLCPLCPQRSGHTRTRFPAASSGGQRPLPVCAKPYVRRGRVGNNRPRASSAISLFLSTGSSSGFAFTCLSWVMKSRRCGQHLEPSMRTSALISPAGFRVCARGPEGQHDSPVRGIKWRGQSIRRLNCK